MACREPGRTELQIVVVEDHAALGRGLELLLSRAGHRVTGLATSAASGAEMILRRLPDVAIVDLRLGAGDGTETIGQVVAARPAVAVLAYTGFADRTAVEAAFAAGARGCALKAGGKEDLLTAVQAVASGERYLDPSLRALLADPVEANVLTSREREILELVAAGVASEEVAERLVVSPLTVQTHIRNAARKLGAHNRTHAVALAAVQGEITLGGRAVA